MITVMAKGDYRLIETKSQVKILYLDGQAYAWVWAKDIGEILVTTHQPHTTDHVLAVGRYRMYQVENDPSYVDLPHLELLVGPSEWQGYLLPTGLPLGKKIRARIIPTTEQIT
jgi:hypothetical protein